MRVCITERNEPAVADLRPAGERAPDLALPWVIALRYGMLAGLAALILIANFAIGARLPIVWLAVPFAVMAGSNLLSRRLTEWVGSRHALGVLLALDTLALTAMLALTGGPANPFTLLYLVQITLSAVILSKQWTWALGALAVGCFGFLFAVHARLAIFEAHHTAQGFSAHLVGMWIAFTAAALLITVFIGKVSEELRKREQERLELQDRLARQERLGSIATLAAGAAHELGTPLATIAVTAKDMEYLAAGSGDFAEDARLIRTEVDRCRAILRKMSAEGAEPQAEAPAAVALAPFLESVRALFPQHKASIRIAAPPNAGAAFPEEAARQALAALVRNGLDAGAEGAQVELMAAEQDGMLRFTVKDRGCGMGRDALNRLGEPFFTTKEPGRGMGLGVFLARVFAQRMDGSLVFESTPGRGTKAILEFPIQHGDRQREAAGTGG